MEEVLGLIVLIVISVGIRVAFNAAEAHIRMKERGSLQPMQARLRADSSASDDGEVMHFQRVEARGLFPVDRTTNLVFLVSVLDATEKDPSGEPNMQPVLCYINRFQEPETIAFGDRSEVGEVHPQYGWEDWTQIALVPSDTLVPARSGVRSLTAFVLACDAAAMPHVMRGFLDSGEPLASWALDFTWNCKVEGYGEASERRALAEETTIRLAVAIACSDGEVHESEGATIREWMSQRLSMLEGDEREARKTKFNAAVQDAYARARDGRLVISTLVSDLSSQASASGRTQAVELCLDIMAADEHVADDELKLVNDIAKKLKVDLELFQGLKDKRLAGLASNIKHGVDVRALLNIDPSWDQAEIRSHLNKLYSQWNSRAEAMQDPTQRAQAEQMLEVIARARQELLVA